jgi:hypothetical protein
VRAPLKPEEKTKLRVLKTNMESMQPINQFEELLTQVKRIGWDSTDFYNDVMKFAREAYSAVALAKCLCAEQLKLLPQECNSGDAELSVDGHSLFVEIVSITRPGSKPHQDDKKFTIDIAKARSQGKGMIEMPDEEAHVPVADLAKQICEQVTKKYQKNELGSYKKDVSLLVVDLAGGIINFKLNEIIPVYKNTLEKMILPFPKVWAHVTIESDPNGIIEIK